MKTSTVRKRLGERLGFIFLLQAAVGTSTGLSNHLIFADYAIVQPVRLDSSGDFMTYNLHFAKEDRANENFRRKRDLEEVQLRETSRVLYSIANGDRRITLNLTANEDLVPRDFVVERIKGIDSTSGQPITSSFSRGMNVSCLFQGHVEDDANSRVALSTCHGLTGLIIIEQGEYFLEPVEPYSFASEDRAQAHKIYRRDLSKILHNSEPMLHFDKLENSGNLNRVRLDDEYEQTEHLEAYLDPLFTNIYGDSSNEFCGVSDTGRRYRHVVRRREQWQKRHISERQRSENAKTRSKRSVSAERMIEMLVVADKSMVDYYEANDNGGVEKYVLTIVNIVSELFKDASIGNSLHVSIVRLILLEDEEKGPKITRDAEKTLDRFCKWAKKINPKGDDHPNHHDVAVLLTRKEICTQANKSCETLGLAHVAGMCQSHRSCSLNQDVGLSLAYTVTHELGHNFAMHHDGQMNDCHPNPRYNYVMSPHLTSSKLQMRWSSCSRKYITRFLNRNWGFCLNDKPADHPEFSPPTALPGVIYDADHQCRLMFGEQSGHCKGIDDICNRLWCRIDGTCRTRLHAAVPGTKCGKNKWCLGGKCVSNTKQPIPIDGGWGTWSGWTSCSRTCGIGVSSSVRHCDNPTPQDGGNYCTGERKRYKTCNKWRCRESEDTPSFRAAQCAQYNDVPYKNKTFSWKPVESAIYPCELHCFTQSGKHSFADRMRDKVIDGTPCFPGSDDICVDGICRRLGCDKNIGSRALEDRCGVCHGDGSACREVKDVFRTKKGEEYSPAALIPIGARNIEIFEMEAVTNFLALRHATNKTLYYLNGNYMIQWDTMFQLAGTQFSYRRENETRDIILAPGPLTEPLMLMVLFVEENPGVSIEYTVPYDVNFDPSPEQDYPEFSWRVKGWTECTRECGTGSQSLDIVCEEKIAGVVQDFFCNATVRPVQEHRSCNETPCPARWWTSRWEPCPITCGSRRGVQQRDVQCVKSIGEEDDLRLNETECSSLERPDDTRKCRSASHKTCPVWKTGDWQKCSRPCGGGVKNRTVKCVTRIRDFIEIEDTPVVDEIDLPSNGRLSRFRKVRKRSRNADVFNAGGLLMSIDAEPIELELDDDGFNMEEDSECDSSVKPIAQRQCHVELCPTATSPVTEASSTDLTFEKGTLRNVTTLSSIESEEYFHASETSDDEAVAGTADSTTQNTTDGDVHGPVGIIRNNLAADGGQEYRNHTANDSLPGNVTSQRSVERYIDESETAIPYDYEGNEGSRNRSRNEEVEYPPTESEVLVTEAETVEDDGDEPTARPVEGPPQKRSTSSAAPPENLLLTPSSHAANFRRFNKTDEFDIDGISLENSNRQLETRKSFDEYEKNLPPGGLLDIRTVENPREEENPIEIDGYVPESEDVILKETIVPELRNVDLDFDVGIETFEDEAKKDLKRPTNIIVTTTFSSAAVREGVKIVKEINALPTKPSEFDSQNPSTALITYTPIEGEWIVGEWSKCSVTCGVGAQVRQVQCSVKNEKLCNETDRPAPAIICNLRPCARWIYGEWSKCSTSCGAGTRTKSIRCVEERTKKILRPHHCRNSPSLSPVEVSCHHSNCLRWKTSRWTSCSEPCGTGVQRRRVVCQRQGQCDPDLKPQSEKSCFARLCVDWKPLKWNKCSVHCGGGIKRRQIICVERESGLKTNESLCQPGLRPTRVERCNMGQCPVTDFDFSNCHADRLSPTFCMLLQKLGRCVQPSLAIQCCVTCKTYLSVRFKNKMS